MTDERTIWDELARQRRRIEWLEKATKNGAKYALTVQCDVNPVPADGVTRYFGGVAGAGWNNAGGESCLYIPRAGTICAAYIFAFCETTAGTAQSWSLYVRLNNTTDTLIETLATNTVSRLWNNDSLSIAVAVGDYIEIKSVNPTWVTNPEGLCFGGTIIVQ
jgi:hypothetical protein